MKMWFKTVTILFGLFCGSNLQTTPPSDLLSDIYGSNDNDISSEETCECVPYYLCDLSVEIKKEHHGQGIIQPSRIEPTECPHYLLKCCDDEDRSEISPEDLTKPPRPKPTQPPRPKGCGYRHFPTDRKTTDGTAEFGEFPWAVAILSTDASNRYNYVCSGTLIHPEVVLTIAHCIKDIKSKPKIRAGEWNSGNNQEKYQHQEVEVASITIHSKYFERKLYNDIALLFLKKPINLAPHINIVCLPPASSTISDERCISSGWRKETFDTGAILSKIDLPIVQFKQCEQLLRQTPRLGSRFQLHESFICAGGEAGKDTCKGDGGSPLVCPIMGQEDRFVQYGIVSWGVGCGGLRVPGVYVNVAHFREWIDEKLKMKGIDIGKYQPF